MPEHINPHRAGQELTGIPSKNHPRHGFAYGGPQKHRRADGRMDERTPARADVTRAGRRRRAPLAWPQRVRGFGRHPSSDPPYP